VSQLQIKCRSFKATPLGEGRLLLEIEDVESEAPTGVYSAATVGARLAEILGMKRPIARNTLAYWRTNLKLPYTALGPKKFLYEEGQLLEWARIYRSAL